MAITTDENIEAVKTMILNNCQNTIREIADDVGISFGEDCSKIAKFLGKTNFAWTIVQRQSRFAQNGRNW